MVTAEALVEALAPLVLRIIRQELRAVGLRPPAPDGPGPWCWSPAEDAWLAVDPPEASGRPQTAKSA